MKVLVACEYSGRVRDAFIRKGHDAMSCDLLPSDSDLGEHYQGDVFDLDLSQFDLMIAHPPVHIFATQESDTFTLTPNDGPNYLRPLISLKD